MLEKAKSTVSAQSCWSLPSPALAASSHIPHASATHARACVGRQLLLLLLLLRWRGSMVRQLIGEAIRLIEMW